MTLERKFRKYELMKMHIQLVKKGDFLVARRLLQFLRKGEIKLMLSDEDVQCEQILDKLGFRLFYGNRYSCSCRL